MLRRVGSDGGGWDGLEKKQRLYILFFFMLLSNYGPDSLVKSSLANFFLELLCDTNVRVTNAYAGK